MLVVDTGAVRVVDLLVQRGACDRLCELERSVARFEGSVDGTVWTPFVVLERKGSGDDAALTVVPQPARYVRVGYNRQGSRDDVDDVRELSVFARSLPVPPG